MQENFADKVLPLDQVLAHIRSDDTALTSSEVANILRYRGAALEAAERITGYKCDWISPVSETVEKPSVAPTSLYVTIPLRWRAATQFVSVQYGNGGSVIYVNRWSRFAKIRISGNRDLSSWCCGCGASGDDDVVKLSYKAGFDCAEQVPELLLVGALKYVAHLYANPGDELYGVTAISDTRQLIGSNPVIASGAGHIWLHLKDLSR